MSEYHPTMTSRGNTGRAYGPPTRSSRCSTRSACARVRRGECRRLEQASTLVFQIVRRAAQRWRRLDAPHLVARVLDGVQFINGIEVTKASKRGVAA